MDYSGDIVGFYAREFFCFGNFEAFQIEWRGRLWPTTEHAYQAAHFFDTDPELAETIYKARSAYDTWILAKQNANKAPNNWEDIKISIMEDICRHKLQQHAYVQDKLRQTLDLEIVEDSPIDSFWGWGEDHKGRNELGKVWMRLRDEMNNEPSKYGSSHVS